MLPTLPETSAHYTLLGPGGADAGAEDITIARMGAGWRVAGRLATTYPGEVTARLEWELAGDLSTRLLYIASTDGFGDEYELELTVTGNGMLAHRSAPDGPSQVELGWGPGVELDYVSAAFPTVAMARFPLGPGAHREVSAVHIGVDDLEPQVLEQVWSAAGPGGVLVVTRATGHRASMALRQDGLLLSYAGLLRLDTASAAPGDRP